MPIIFDQGPLEADPNLGMPTADAAKADVPEAQKVELPIGPELGSEGYTPWQGLPPGDIRNLDLRIHNATTMEVRFPYDRYLVKHVGCLEKGRFNDDNPKDKHWRIPLTQGNLFRMNFLKYGAAVYAPWLDNAAVSETRFPLMEHQFAAMSAIINHPSTILAYEMGLGKTLATFAAIEYMKKHDLLATGPIWYIAPKSGVTATNLEIQKWAFPYPMRCMTYEGAVKALKEYRGTLPSFLVIDESQYIKTETAQRSKTLRAFADAIRLEHGYKSRVVLLTGTPAPKTPMDWHNQVMTAAPGYLLECKPWKLKDRLACTSKQEGRYGYDYYKTDYWWDNEDRCLTCGVLKQDHDDVKDHRFLKSKNEVANLYNRLTGLVLVRLKADCLDLPEKTYRQIKVKPSLEMVNAARLIKSSGKAAAQVLSDLRELSDGFLYTTEKTGERTCTDCDGKGELLQFALVNDYDPMNPNSPEPEYERKLDKCPYCRGTGKVDTFARGTDEFSSPKALQLVDDLEEQESNGRVVVWGGFQGTLDIITKIAQEKNWCVLRLDGRGALGLDETGAAIDAGELLLAMDRKHPRAKELKELYPKVCFVGHPQAAGTGLTFTAANVAIYYSNCFNGGARMQSEDRIHRIGMDENKACMIVDYICLPQDKLVIDNLQQKRRLQSLTLGEVVNYE